MTSVPASDFLHEATANKKKKDEQQQQLANNGVAAEATTNETENDDPALGHVWLWEDTPSNAPQYQVLTAAALNRISCHRYQAGSYTWLDNLMNPVWTWLTYNCLPASMAPNVVTLLGALHCLAVYAAVWYFSYHHNNNNNHDDDKVAAVVPAVVLMVNAYNLVVSYTLDCLDGKQARRLQASTPLGQLLDHGLDSLCLLAHVAANQAVFCTADTLVIQLVLQTSFYMAQWEEYYTGTLPHATGPFGVTEASYGLALGSFLHGWAMPVAQDRAAFYSHAVLDDVQDWVKSGWLSRRLVNVLSLEELLVGWERRHLVLFVWSMGMTFLCLLSVERVWRHLGNNNDSNSNNKNNSHKHRWTAFWHLASPLVVCLFTGLPEFSDMTVQSAAHDIDIDSMIQQTLRWKSLAIGILFCHLTIKVIVFSMARQAVAVVQWDVVPAAVAVVWTHTDPRLTVAGHALVWQALTVLWMWRLVSWNVAATRQICAHLNIPVWSLPEKNKTKNNNKTKTS